MNKILLVISVLIALCLAVVFVSSWFSCDSWFGIVTTGLMAMCGVWFACIAWREYKEYREEDWYE